MYKNNKRKKQNNCLICFNSLYEEISIKSIFSINQCICDRCLDKFISINKTQFINGVETLFLYNYNDFFKTLLYQYKGCYDVELKDVFLYKYKNFISVCVAFWLEELSQKALWLLDNFGMHYAVISVPKRIEAFLRSQKVLKLLNKIW